MINIKYLDSEQRNQIGFSFIIDKLEVMTSLGISEKRNIQLFQSKEALLEEYENIETLREAIRKDKEALGEIERVFCRVKDIQSTVKRCSNLVTLDDVELYEIKYFSLLMEELRSAYKRLNISIKGLHFNSLDKVTELLDPEKKKMPTFYIYEVYSEKLKNIRANKKSLEQQIFKESNAEKAEKLKSKRLEIVIQEEEEELKIRKTLTEELSGYAELLEENLKAVARLDFLIAKCKLAQRYGAVKPVILQAYNISLKKMFNPQVKSLLENKGKSFTPLDIELKSGTTVITGANMGGKSVFLKTLTLNLLLGQCGFFVFAEEAGFPLLDFIHFVSCDMQSVSQGLSSFGAEIVKLREIIEDAKSGNGLICLDEFAKGTNPTEGSYLVKSLCRFLNSLKSISVVSTHYDGVVEPNMTHYQVIGLKNTDFNKLRKKVEVNKERSVNLIQENMEYRLERVLGTNEVPKDALNIARLLGLQSEIIDIAMDFYENKENGRETDGK